MTILERDPMEEQRQQQRAKRLEEERQVAQEKLYQVGPGPREWRETLPGRARA